jgi:NADPH:quinone reductase-like Zn-dependent oxidoreductase
MKASSFAEYGDETVMRIQELPTPEPGHGQVLVRVRAVGVNHVDLDIRAGVSRIPIAFPHILGIELAGEIEAIGPGVHDWAVGDRVTPHFQVSCGSCSACERGQQMHCARLEMYGIQRQGGYAEYVVAEARSLIRIPDRLGFAAAASIQTTYGTAWHCLVSRGRVRVGETVLVSAAGSGVGTAAVQIAKRMGARVIATAGSDAKLELARAQGADDVVNYTTSDIASAVRNLTDGHGVDMIFEHVGGDVFQRSLLALATGGRITVCGGHAGEVVPLDLIELFRTEHEIIGCARANYDEIGIVLRMAGEGLLEPVIHRTLPLDQASEAHRILAQREAFGKVVLEV